LRSRRPDANRLLGVFGAMRLGMVALAPVLWSALDQASRQLFGWRLVPTVIEPATAVATLAALALLLMTGWRWRLLDRTIRDQAAEVLTRIETDAADRLDALERRARIHDLVDAGEGLRIVYQPVVDLATKEISGYEALSRFDSGTTPGWFAEAHDVGMGVDLEVLAARRAIEGFLPRCGQLGLNVSPDSLDSEDMRELLLSALDAFPVVLEITEHAAVANYDRLRGVLAELRTLGAGVAIDDAGAGFASFRHVIALAPDTVKLDRSLISGIGTDSARASLARSLVDFASDMNIRLIAEGIETEDELAACLRVGIPAGQGFLLGRPAPLPTERSAQGHAVRPENNR
jgi:EAL domain-containing protein (putative c-di-GMP-specific phosphodiesterase class I)